MQNFSSLNKFIFSNVLSVRTVALFAAALAFSSVSYAQSKPTWEQTVNFIETQLPNCTTISKWGEWSSAKVYQVSESELIVLHSVRGAYTAASDSTAFRANYHQWARRFPLNGMSSIVSTKPVSMSSEVTNRFGVVDWTEIQFRCLDFEKCIQTDLVDEVSSGWFNSLEAAYGALYSDQWAMESGEPYRVEHKDQPGVFLWSRSSGDRLDSTRKGSFKNLDEYQLYYDIFSPEANYSITCQDNDLSGKLAKAFSRLIELGGGKAQEALFE